MKVAISHTLTALLLAALGAVATAHGEELVKAKLAGATQELNRAEFDAWLAKPEQLLIIDVRRPDEVTAIGGLPVYLSVQLADLEDKLAWIPKERTIVTVSNHAARARRAAELLVSRGFKVAGTLGAQNYEEQGGQLTRIAPNPAAAAAKPIAR
jgi:rhodanese-related sulfurtransferase